MGCFTTPTDFGSLPKMNLSWKRNSAITLRGNFWFPILCSINVHFLTRTRNFLRILFLTMRDYSRSVFMHFIVQAEELPRH